MKAAIAALAVAITACGNGGTDPPMNMIDASDAPDAAPRQVVMESLPLVVNEIAEAKLVGGSGDRARIRMTAPSASLDWNIHGHANGGTQVIAEELRVMSVDYVFAPSAQADWYLLLRNKGQTDMTVELQIELYGDLTWSGWL